MRFSFIDAKRAEFAVACLCEVLEVSQSGYFAWKSRPASEYQRKDMLLLAHIRERFRLSRKTYGSPRMHADLRDDGITAGRHRIARLMRDNDLKARQRRRFKKTTDSNHGGLVAPNHLDQDFAATAPDQKWAADISYFWTAEGWLYLAIVLDLISRRIVGWAVSDRLKKKIWHFPPCRGRSSCASQKWAFYITPIVRMSGLVAPERPDFHSDRPFGRLAPQGVPEWPDPHSDRPRSVSFPGPVGRPGTPCGEVLPRR